MHFFQKRGYWCNRLFKYFNGWSQNQITQQNFINGMVRILKNNDEGKIKFLFTFLSKYNTSIQQINGIQFNSFLIMLYTLPKKLFLQMVNNDHHVKRQLKEMIIQQKNNNILNKQQQNIDKRSKRKRDEKLNKNNGQQIQCKNNKLEQQLYRIMDKKQKYQNVIKIKIDQQYIQINMIKLIKIYANSIYKNYFIHVNHQSLLFQQFYHWISKNTLFFLYFFKGFHQEIWEFDHVHFKYQFLNHQFQFTSNAVIYINNMRKDVVTSLLNQILLVFDLHNLTVPISIICLEGLSVKKITDQDRGDAIEISHRDEIYPVKRFYYKSNDLAMKWMDYFKYYQGGSITKLYEMGNKIGMGKFSVVYNGKQNITGQKYAIKVIQSYKLKSSYKKLIAHESNIMQNLSHPIVINFKQSIQTKTHTYIITELIEGKDMMSFVKDSIYLSEEEAAQIIRQVFIGVRYLHSLGIAHRDLKPENIMIEVGRNRSLNNVKIIDFGFANYLQIIKDLPSEETLAGTPNYIAPESLRLERGITEKIDIFAIGSILYFALSGTFAFHGCNLTQVIEKTLQGNYQINDKRWRLISNQAKDLIKKLLQNNPNNRISIEQALIHPWFQKFPHLELYAFSQNQSIATQIIS